MFTSLGWWWRPGFLLAGGALLVGGGTLAFMEVFEPVAVVWMLPTLGSAIGLIFGAAAFIALHRDLARRAPRLAATSTTLAAVTLGAALVAAASVSAAMARAELPSGVVLVSIPVALLGFVATGAVVSIAALVTDALPRLVAAVLGSAVALTLVLAGYVVTTGEVSPVLLVAVLAGWGLALVGLSRATPQGPPHP